MGRIEGEHQAEDATNKMMKSWFDIRMQQQTTELADRVQDAVDSITYSENPKDPAGAPESYILQIVGALDEWNAFEVVRDSEQAKELIKKIVNNPKPPELKQRILDSMPMWSAGQKCDLKFF